MVRVRGPRLDRRIELGDARDAAGIVRELRVVAEIVAPDRLHQPPEDAVAVAGDQHVLPSRSG